MPVVVNALGIRHNKHPNRLGKKNKDIEGGKNKKTLPPSFKGVFMASFSIENLLLL